MNGQTDKSLNFGDTKKGNVLCVNVRIHYQISNETGLSFIRCKT